MKKISTKDKMIEEEVKKTKVAIAKQEEFKKWVEAKFRQVVDRFLIDFVSMHFNYADNKTNTKDGHVIFTVNASEKYHQMSINIFPSALAMYNNGQKEKLIDGIVHECAHIHTDRIAKLAEDRYVTRSQIMDAIENLTEVVAQYIRSLIRNEAPDIYKK